MRITISHNRRKEELIQTVDRSFADLFQGTGLPVKLTDQRKTWEGNVMTFSLTAKMGFISAPIKGTVEITDRDITIDADLGILERMIPTKTAQEMLTTRIRGLLK